MASQAKRATTNTASKSIKRNISDNLYWIHCNKCFEMYSRKVKLFFLLSCHHLACESCTKLLSNEKNTHNKASYKCPVCSKTVRGRTLGNNIPSNLKLLFHPKPWTDCIFSVEIFHFQLKQRKCFYNGFILQLHKYHKRLTEKQEYWRKRTKKTYYEWQALKSERKKLESRVRCVIDERKNEESGRNLEKSAISESTLNQRLTQTHFLGTSTCAGRGRLIPPTRSVSTSSYSPVNLFNKTFEQQEDRNNFRL